MQDDGPDLTETKGLKRNNRRYLGFNLWLQFISTIIVEINFQWCLNCTQAFMRCATEGNSWIDY